jgi:hypothetical protein
MPAQTVIQLRRDTTTNWESTNPVLAAGEVGFDSTENKIKLGDGTSEWLDLDYASGGGIVVSEISPESPSVGDLWFNSSNAVTYIYYDSFWIELIPGGSGDPEELEALATELNDLYIKTLMGAV